MANTRSWLIVAAAALLILAVVIGTGQTDELEAVKVEKRSADDLADALREILQDDEGSINARGLEADDDDAVTDDFVRQLMDSSSEDDDDSYSDGSELGVSKKFFRRIGRAIRRVRVRRIIRKVGDYCKRYPLRCLG